MKDGILLINKPQNWTSHDCVAVCRRVLGIKKTGHGGTLDPMAEGLLPIFVGRATRLIEYLDVYAKTYLCTAQLGIKTDTQDIWGQVLEECSASEISIDDVKMELEKFNGLIHQVPPMYSALKKDGRRLYEYAREGRTLELDARPVYIHSMEILNIDMQACQVTFRVKCSKGTYVRTICDDLGKALGCGAAMCRLIREEIGDFTLENSVSPVSLKEMTPSEAESYMMCADRSLTFMDKAMINADRAKYFSRGNAIRWHQVTTESEVRDDGLYDYGENKRDGIYRVYCSTDGRFLGIGHYDSGSNELKADKILVTAE